MTTVEKCPLWICRSFVKGQLCQFTTLCLSKLGIWCESQKFFSMISVSLEHNFKTSCSSWNQWCHWSLMPSVNWASSRLPDGPVQSALYYRNTFLCLMPNPNHSPKTSADHVTLQTTLVWLKSLMLCVLYLSWRWWSQLYPQWSAHRNGLDEGWQCSSLTSAVRHSPELGPEVDVPRCPQMRGQCRQYLKV